MIWLLSACTAAPAAAPTPLVPPTPEPAVPAFHCATAAADLGHPGASVLRCSEETVLRGLFTVVLAAPEGRVNRFVAAPGGQVLPTGGAAFAAFLRASALWSAKDVAASELRVALLAFDAWPPGFGPDSGPRTVGEGGKPIRLPLPNLEVSLEAPFTAWDAARRAAGGASPGVSHPRERVRAVLTGGPAQPLVWTITHASTGAVLDTWPLEP
jgi:hypothetical protein